MAAGLTMQHANIIAIVVVICKVCVILIRKRCYKSISSGKYRPTECSRIEIA